MVSWGFSLIFTGLLVRELVRRSRRLDFRAIGAAAYLGLGGVWALGLSSSAAMMMATPSAMPKELISISGVIPLTQTIFLWQSLVLAARPHRALRHHRLLLLPRSREREDRGDDGHPFRRHDRRRRRGATPAERLEHSPVLTLLAVT